MKPARILLTVLLVVAGALMPPSAFLLWRTWDLLQAFFISGALLTIIWVPTLIFFGILIACRVRTDYAATTFCTISLMASLYIRFDYYAATPARRFEILLQKSVPQSVRLIGWEGSFGVVDKHEACAFTIAPDDFILLASNCSFTVFDPDSVTTNDADSCWYALHGYDGVDFRANGAYDYTNCFGISPKVFYYKGWEYGNNPHNPDSAAEQRWFLMANQATNRALVYYKWSN